VKEMIMAEPALILSSANQPAASCANPTSAERRAAVAVRLRCRVEAAPDRGVAIQQAADDATDPTGFSMVGVAG
jgi:hypothetical protein